MDTETIDHSSALAGDLGPDPTNRVGDVHAAVDLLGAVDYGECGFGDLDGLAGAAQRLRGFAAEADARIARRRDELWSTVGAGFDPNGDAPGGDCGGDGVDGEGSGGAGGMADTSLFDKLGDRRSGTEQERDRARGRVGAAMPSFEAALESGEIDTAHLDAVTAALGRLTNDADDDAVDQFKSHEAELLGYAKNERPERFRRRCTDLARRLSVDHGVKLAERQKAAASIKRWWGRDGVWHLHAELDAETAAKIEAALDAHLQTTRSKDANSELSWQRLDVESFTELVTASSALDARAPELSVLIDWDTLRTGVFGPNSVCETSTGAPLTPAAVRRMACDAGILPVVLGGDGITLDVGRKHRLATRAQRQALRAMCRTCAHPNCEVAFERCRIHHIVDWLNNGPTDLDNLLPVCDRHHHLVHEGGWGLTMSPDRVATWTTPTGTVWHTRDTRDRLPADGAKNDSPAAHPASSPMSDRRASEGAAGDRVLGDGPATGPPTVGELVEALNGEARHHRRPPGDPAGERPTSPYRRAGATGVGVSALRRSARRDRAAPAHPPTLFSHDAQPAAP